MTTPLPAWADTDYMSLGQNSFNARLIRWTSTFEGQCLLCDWIPVFKTSNKANEWLVVIPPDALIEECSWGGDKFPETCREIREMRRDGQQTGTDPNTDTLGLCRAARREGTGLINEHLWVVESLCPHSPLCHQRSQWLHQFAAIITSIGQ